MNRKYEEMTKEELEKKANEILKRLNLLVCAGEIEPDDISELREIIATMKDYRENKTVIKKMTMKEKTKSILDRFFEMNSNYVIEAYTRTDTEFLVEKVYIPSDRNWESDGEKEYKVLWNDRNNYFKIPYDEVLICYEEMDKYNQHMVYAILKSGIRIRFECVGMRI